MFNRDALTISSAGLAACKRHAGDSLDFPACRLISKRKIDPHHSILFIPYKLLDVYFGRSSCADHTSLRESLLNPFWIWVLAVWVPLPYVDFQDQTLTMLTPAPRLGFRVYVPNRVPLGDWANIHWLRFNVEEQVYLGKYLRCLFGEVPPLNLNNVSMWGEGVIHRRC